MELVIWPLVEGLFNVAMAIVAIVAMTYTLRWLNKMTGNRFDETLIAASPNVRLGYFGARLIAYAFVIGSILS
ncbi:MAG: hypothetical protein RLZZ602_1589 [Pseudomonadota bacterium]|jgi:hypothetical protein